MHIILRFDNDNLQKSYTHTYHYIYLRERPLCGRYRDINPHPPHTTPKLTQSCIAFASFMIKT